MLNRQLSIWILFLAVWSTRLYAAADLSQEKTQDASGEGDEAMPDDEDEQWRQEVAFILAKSGNSSPEPDEEYLPNASTRGTSDDDEDKPATRRRPQSVKALPQLCKKCQTSHLRGACPVKRFRHKAMRNLYGRHLRGRAERRDALVASRAASLAPHTAAAAAAAIAPSLPAPVGAPMEDKELIEEAILEERVVVHPDPQSIMAEIATWGLLPETFEEIRCLVVMGGTAHHIEDSLASRLGVLMERYHYNFGFAYDHPGGFYNCGSVYICPPGV